jgi:glycine/D-amino acid oxidase-like deaminating enzyme
MEDKMNTDQLKDFKKSPESYWLSSTQPLKYPTLDEDIEVDVLIIGGGLAGITCAYQLLDQGLSLAILEGNTVLGGVTAHTTAKITSQHGLIYDKVKTTMGGDLAQQYADANQWAIREIKRISDEHEIECDYVTEPAFIYTQEEKQLQKIEKEVNAARDLGIKASFVDSIPFNIPIKGAVRFDDQARFHPLKFGLGMTKHIAEQGVQIFENSRAIDIEENDCYVVTTSQ